ncbi:HlyD family secretion protein [Roseimaritima multifibrata]|uniref:HlyD family secretion protein n=1 Tax=Roseimaritima multifibrata TaxID=1930274 RepID=A0A517MN42_9BACT|nr:HlyD family secretion protein [Roseimaritima multifibrata]
MVVFGFLAVSNGCLTVPVIPPSSADVAKEQREEIRAASGPLGLVDRVLRIIDNREIHDAAASRSADVSENHWRSVVQAIVETTHAGMVVYRIGPITSSLATADLQFVGPAKDDFQRSEVQANLLACFRGMAPQPSAVPADSVLQSTGRIWTVSDPLNDVRLLVWMPSELDLVSETVWLRCLNALVPHVDASIQQGMQPAASSSLSRFHHSLDASQTAAQIANDMRFLLQLDRVTVLVRRGRRYRVEAVSGAAQFHRRSNLIRALEQLAGIVAVTKQPFLYPHEDELPPQIEEALADYLDQSSVDRMRMIPLVADAATDSDGVDVPRPLPFAMLVLEKIAAESEALNVVAIPDPGAMIDHAAWALHNSQSHSRLFLLPVWRFLGGMWDRGKRWWVLVACLLLVGLIAAGALIQVEHYVVAEGRLQPAHRQHLFAPLDGVIDEVRVQHGDFVTPGDVLVTLQSSELERQLEESLGQIQTIERRLTAVRSNRVSEGRRRVGDASAVGSAVAANGGLAGEEQQLVAERDNLQRQVELLRKLQEQLQVQSPLAGQVVSWDLQQRIGSRPVSRGHQLLTIADVQGDWILELVLPDEDLGTVRSAAEIAGKPLAIEYALATDPEHQYAATLNRIGTAAERDETRASYVPLEARLAEEPNQRHVGAEVRAKIACGQRSLAASWFSDVVRVFQQSIGFHFWRAER